MSPFTGYVCHRCGKGRRASDMAVTDKEPYCNVSEDESPTCYEQKSYENGDPFGVEDFLLGEFKASVWGLEEEQRERAAQIEDERYEDRQRRERDDL